MKLKFIFSPFVIITVGLIYISASGGVANIQNADRTGSPVSNSNCSACHSGGSFNTMVRFSVSNASGEVTSYVPGETYSVKVHIQSNGASGNGFQVTGLLDDFSAAGSASSLSADGQIITIGGKYFFEQSDVATDSVYEMSWVAPMAGNGNVTFYGSALSVDADGGTASDEYFNIPDFVLTEDISSNISTVERSELKLFPNPAIDQIHLNVNSVLPFSVQILDLVGKNWYSNSEVYSGNPINVSSLPSGTYVVQLQIGTEKTTSQFIKQ